MLKEVKTWQALLATPNSTSGDPFKKKPPAKFADWKDVTMPLPTTASDLWEKYGEKYDTEDKTVKKNSDIPEIHADDW